MISVVIPSLSASPQSLQTLCDDYVSAGMTPTVIPTSGTLTEAIRDTQIPWVSLGANPGFSATVNFGANKSEPWEWIVISNDDIHIDPEKLRETMTEIQSRHDSTERVMAYLDPVPPRPLPTPAKIFMTLSLCRALLNRIPQQKRSTLKNPCFRPFSCVAISKGLWDELNGLDERYVYTYEDSDFARRALIAGATTIFSEDTGVIHERSRTGSANPTWVVPASVWSAREYLKASGMPHVLASTTCLAALIPRALLVLARPNRCAHLLSIRRSARALLSGRRPELVPFTEPRTLG